MPKKRKTLPENFKELLDNGNIQELKAIFDICELNAYGGFGKHTALGFDNCPHELAAWLVEQGADLQATDTYQNTPLHIRARSFRGNITSLLELGADVNAGADNTPLHAAADAHLVENTTILLAHGASVNAVNRRGYTPLELSLLTCANIHIVNTAQIAKLLLQAGAPITPNMKELVTEIGKRFEFHRANFKAEDSMALDELYHLFDVVPVPRRIIHDGIAPITTTATTWQKQHQDFWNQLVPSRGPAETVQGELIRISGRIANELQGNGGVNWSNEFRKMANAFWSFVKADLPDAEIIITPGNTDRLCELAVQWVIAHPDPIRLPPVDYKL